MDVRTPTPGVVPFIRPILVTGISTAMRRGDCCLMKWSDVDLKEGFISVKTAKTGENVHIPVFPMLAEELAKARAAAGTSPFCFPGKSEGSLMGLLQAS